MADPLQPDLRPIVLHPIGLAAFIQHTIHKVPGQVQLLICSNQESFVRELLACIKHEKMIQVQEAEAAGLPPTKLARVARRKHDLLIPTLRQLASASNVKITFTETLLQLQAHLAVYTSPDDDHLDERQTIALLNPVSLHRNISSFSAQGLSRTFASAVEMATRCKAKLLIVECPSRVRRQAEPAEVASDDAVMQDNETELGLHGDNLNDLWDEEVSILNGTTRSFGAGERGWIGRTVKIRTVAERWCVFRDPYT